MILFLDSSVLFELERGNPAIIKELAHLQQMYPNVPQLPFMVYAEFLFGLPGKNSKNQQKARLFVQPFPIIQTTKRTAEILTTLKEENDTEAHALPLADLLIAAQTIEHGGMLLTRDRDFTKIRQLQYMIV